MDLVLLYTTPEIEEWVTESQLKERYDVTFQRSGWYELENGDFALVIERYGKYKIFVWIGLDPRDEMEKMLDLPWIKR